MRFATTHWSMVLAAAGGAPSDQADRGTGRALRRLLVSAVRLRAPARLRRGGCPRPDADLLRPAARAPRTGVGRPGAGAVPQLSAHRDEELPGQRVAPAGGREARGRHRHPSRSTPRTRSIATSPSLPTPARPRLSTSGAGPSPCWSGRLPTFAEATPSAGGQSCSMPSRPIWAAMRPPCRTGTSHFGSARAKPVSEPRSRACAPAGEPVCASSSPKPSRTDAWSTTSCAISSG